MKKYLDFLKGNKTIKEGLSTEKPIKIGDIVVPINFDDLTPRQHKYLTNKRHFYVDDIVYKNGNEYIDIGYNIPLKSSRFSVIDKKIDSRVLFLQFNLAIKHEEEDKENMFRGYENMFELFSDLITEKSPNTIVDFYMYKDVYRIKNSYYVNNVDIKDYDFVFFGFMSSIPSSYIYLKYVQKNNIPHLTYGTSVIYDNKLYGQNLVEDLGLPYIPTISTSILNKKIIEIVKEDFGFPVVAKDITLDQGKGVFKIESMEELIQLFKDNRSNRNIYQIQKMIRNDGDYRIITVKGKAELTVKRQSISDVEFRSNVSMGGKAIKTDVSPEIIKMCEDISKHVKGDILGFDILIDLDTGEYYVMEINAAPGFTSSSIASGISLPDVISNHIVNEIK